MTVEERIANFLRGNSKTFPMLHRAVGGTKEELIGALDAMRARGEVDQSSNGWIYATKPIDTSGWTRDDWDWIHGTGRFSQ